MNVFAKIITGIFLIILLTSCSPVHIFYLKLNSGIDSSISSLSDRLETFLLGHEFNDVGKSISATGDIGCGKNAPDRVSFEKRWQEKSWGGTIYHRINVHKFSCQGNWYLVIISDAYAEEEAKSLRAEIADEFSSEISAGMMQVTTRYRLVLE